jgi:hypothetical protein
VHGGRSDLLSFLIGLHPITILIPGIVSRFICTRRMLFVCTDGAIGAGIGFQK